MNECLHVLFEASAAANSTRTAVVDQTAALTYGDLDRAANRMAHRIRRVGAGPEVRVGVCADRGVDLVVALLAVLKSGAAYVPLDPHHPPERRRHLLDDARCRLVVGDERFRAELDDRGATYVPIRADDETGTPDYPPVTGVRPANAAYVIHTSGSSGPPKGVVVTHANVARLFDATREELGFGPDDVWTLFHSFAFDFSVWELWGALLHGGRLVVVPHADSRAPASFLRLLLAEGVTVLNQTPSAFRQLMSAAADAVWPDTALRLVMLGGEALAPNTLRHWIARYGHDRPRLVNMYGITETTVHVTAHSLTALDTEGSPIGRPLRDLRLHVLDDALEPVPDGAAGELYVSGAGVARGYLDRPALTAERFVPDPVGGPGDRMYRSGDRAVRRDGETHYLGRTDSQVKLRGFRVEPGEIEAEVRGDPAVREAIVRLDDTGDPYLVCYLVADPDANADVVERRLRTALAARLPSHLVPACFVFVDAMPLTANGKLDVRQLPVARRAWRAPTAGPTAAATLTRIFEALLDRSGVGPDDDFFGLGGDSMTAVRATSLARTAGLRLSVQSLFRHPTVAGLAALCATPPEPPVEPVGLGELLAKDDRGRLPQDVCDAYPLTALQTGMIYHSELCADATLYHDLVSVRLAGELDLAALRRSLDLLAARHEVLRTSFDLGNYSEPLQLVHRAAQIPLDVADEDLDTWWRREWPSRRFEFDQAPLLRCRGLRHDDGTFDLALSAHHAILDGWSFALLATELLTTYDRCLGGAEPASHEAVPGRFRDLVVLERAVSSSAAARRFWADRLAGASAPSLPPASGAATPPPLDAQVRLALPADEVAAVRRFAATLRVPAKSVWLAVHLSALATVTDSDDVVTCVVVNGRAETAGSDTALGLFVNCVPLRARVGGRTTEELVGAVFAAELAHQPYQRYPLASIQRDEPDVRLPVLFNYAEFHPLDTLSALDNLTVLEWYFSDRTSFPVVVDVVREPMSEDWMLVVRVDPGQTGVETADRFATAFLGGLRRLTRESRPADVR